MMTSTTYPHVVIPASAMSPQEATTRIAELSQVVFDRSQHAPPNSNGREPRNIMDARAPIDSFTPHTIECAQPNKRKNTKEDAA